MKNSSNKKTVPPSKHMYKKQTSDISPCTSPGHKMKPAGVKASFNETGSIAEALKELDEGK